MERLNEAEWLLEPFHEAQVRGFEWSFAADAGVAAQVSHKWQSVSVAWEGAPAGATVAHFERTYDLDLADADRLCLRLSHASDQRLTVKAVVDGVDQTVVDSAPGSNRFAEYEGPIQGQHLERLTIEITTAMGGDSNIDLLWLIAVSTAARQRSHAQATPYDPEWPVFLRTDTPALAPRLGLLLPDGTDGLRKRIAQPAYAAAWQAVRRQAEAFLNSQPESGIREHLARPGVGTGRYEHDLGPGVDETQAISAAAMQICSLAGLAGKRTSASRASPCATPSPRRTARTGTIPS